LAGIFRAIEVVGQAADLWWATAALIYAASFTFAPFLL
jgi:hypothetical protein